MMEQIEVNDTTLAIRREGEGPPVLLVHGSASDMRTWEPQMEPLAVGHQVLAYSRRYHRPNAEIAEGSDYSMAEQVDDLVALIDSLDAPVLLVGHSYGGVLALLATLRLSTKVQALVLEEPPAFTLFTSDPPRPAEIFRLLLTRPGIATALIRFGATAIAPAGKAARRGDHEAMVAALGRGILGPRAFAELAPERREQARENSPPQELLGSGFLRIDAAAVARIDCPALIVSGAESPVLWPRIADALAGMIPEARRAIVPGASHIAHEDNPQAFNTALLAFLTEVEATD